jgi:hypothetical protein
MSIIMLFRVYYKDVYNLKCILKQIKPTLRFNSAIFLAQIKNTA